LLPVLRGIRVVAPELPMAVSLDMHANVTEAMVSRADVICGYHTYPHVDMDQTAALRDELLDAAWSQRADFVDEVEPHRVGFRTMARALVECAGRGVCTSDCGELTYRKVRRPIYPLDGVNALRGEWQ
jgi:microcystin degradation protein MlrC